MDARGYPTGSIRLTRRQSAARTGSGVAVFFLGAVLLTPWLAIAGVALLATGHAVAGCVCLLAAIGYRALASAAVHRRETR